MLAWITITAIDSGERLTAADGLDSEAWQEAWSGSDDGDELDQLEVTAPSYLIDAVFYVVVTPYFIAFVMDA